MNWSGWYIFLRQLCQLCVGEVNGEKNVIESQSLFSFHATLEVFVGNVLTKSFDLLLV